MKTLSNIKVKNKTVLLRADLNSPLKIKMPINNERIKQSAITIKELKRKGAKIVIIAHQGRPKGKDFTSLKHHAELLSKYTKVKFIEDIIGKKATVAIKKIKPGEAILLENIRKEKDEFHPEKKDKNKILRALVPLADIYINDAFSVSHRKQTSITGFPAFLPSAIGRLMENEIKSLKKIKKSKYPLFILGGAKPKGNLKLLKKGKILATGLFAQELRKKRYIKHKNILLPVDQATEIKGKRVEYPINDFPKNKKILDIGKMTIEKYSKEIKKAKSIFMKGPAGYSEDKKFSKGTISLLKAISKSKAYSIIGGGHLSSTLKTSKINPKKFNHVSLSGGALASYIAGEKLPGLEVLK